jgi:hypothetical protein
MNLTDEQIEELDALAWVNDTLKGPSFLMRKYYRDPVVGPLVRHGLISWGPAPTGFDTRIFAGTTITDAGRAALAAATRSTT